MCASNRLHCFAFIFILLLMVIVLAGCGGNKSMSSPRVYGQPSDREETERYVDTFTVADNTTDDIEDSSQVGDKEKAPAVVKTKNKIATRDELLAAKEKKETVNSIKTLEEQQYATLKKEAELQTQYYIHVDDEDSASAVDDDIWRLFDLAEEYYAMGVLANREASWEEAQYYFEKCLKIMANLDVETDTLLSPEAVKYSEIMDNVVSDYRVTLRSLGELETDVTPSVLVERFGDLERRLGADSVRVFSGETRPVKYDLPIVMNDRVKKSIIYFQTVANEAFTKWLGRSTRFAPLFRDILNEHGLPEDLIYLSLVESGYNPNAYSWARAMGLWQFISSTGRLYGLNRDWWIDERKDPIKATHAAARFLKDLYDQFGSWELAMAAYNGGPGRVRSTIKKQRTIDFWKLKLKRQTMDYVPLIYAATIIAHEPEKYGFSNIEYEDPIQWDEVTIDRCLDLKIVAREIDCSFQDLKDLNPEILRNYTPPNKKKYTLRVPVGKKEKFYAEYESMPSPKETSWVRHKIKRGETVSTIAARYGVSQYAILAANNLSQRSKIYAGKELIVPVPLDREDNSGSEKNREYAANKSVYTVRAGDTMWDIARAFGTTVDALRRINYIERGSRIYVGQQLKIPSNATRLKDKNKTSPLTYASKDDGDSPKTGSSDANASGSSSKYTVRSGDTLWELARRFGTTTSNIRRLNGMGRSSRIYPGQVLTVASGDDKEYVIYRVRRGDTLSRIAQKYRTSISRILATNGKTDPDNLSVGEQLKIYVD
ncbi:MAG: LysM peptidoglycan-binding domain-containing protein [candidate division Zixibacteria bacterium]|nr:LysM peptidoglycan-binding domain-containing protein [candidate division Zixibacteria bacterium]